MKTYQLTDFLPTTQKELALRGWDELDVVLFSGDAYIDHPAFGAAVIGRYLENMGLRVAIVPQPNWRDDLRDFKKMGRPRLFFAISAGCMDSMVNHYTANRRLRSNDAYSPNGQAGFRPDRTTTVYSSILKKLYPDVPIVIGGIEASLRRFTHYDYWSDSVHRSILADTGADLLVYGMGEKPIRAIVEALRSGKTLEQCRDIPQTAHLAGQKPAAADNLVELPSHLACVKDKLTSARAFKTIEQESNKLQSKRLMQEVDGRYVVVNPPFAPMTTEELDAVHALPFTRMPHLKYHDKQIPAYEMIRFSVNTHRGCFGGCAFCTISMHQGKFIVSRSETSVVAEVKQIVALPDFKGYLSDLGGPSANMYHMSGVYEAMCTKCRRPSCIFPNVCKNMNVDHRPLLALYRKVDALPEIKKSFIGSGVRYDLLLHRSGNAAVDRGLDDYTQELIARHVSGRLKVAPEHTSDNVLNVMRKPSFRLFHEFKQKFDQINDSEKLNQQIIPYFISSHPGCEPIDMAELAVETKSLNFQLEQVQDFTPTPMTLATEMYYSGINPYTERPIFTARTANDKLAQRQFFFWYQPENRGKITAILRKLGRDDLTNRLFSMPYKRKK